MLCNDLMSTDVAFALASDKCCDAAVKMRDLDIGFLPVCDPETKKVVGAITDRDLCIRVLADDLDGETPVSEVMTREIVSCRPSDDLKTAERTMAQHQKSRIMCIDGSGTLCGILSFADFARREDPPRVAETLRNVKKPEKSNGHANTPTPPTPPPAAT